MSTLSEEKPVRSGPLLFRLAPEFRRCGVYLFVGYLLLAGTVISLEQLGLVPGWDRGIIFLAFLAVPMLGAALLIYRQLLRVDDRGIWRRRFLRWDLWPWGAFSAGQVHQGTGKDSFVFPSKPWWTRCLFLEFLQDKDREYLANRIRCVWTPPPLPVLPAELTIRWGLRRWARLTEKGIRVGKGKRDGGCFFPWDTVLRVRITRLEHARRDFRAAEIILPGIDQPILLANHKARPLWTGADSETLGVFLERAIPPDRLLLTAMIEPPRTIAEAEWRFLDVSSIDRDTTQLAWIMGSTLLLAIVLLLLFELMRVHEANQRPWDFARILGMVVRWLSVGFVAILTWHVLLGRTKQANAMRADLAAWREDLKNRRTGTE